MASLIDELEKLGGQAKDEFAQAEDETTLESLRVRYLGKKGSIAAVLRGMGKLDASERPKVGQVANALRDRVEALIEQGRERLAKAKLEAELNAPPLDITLPGRSRQQGKRHPVSQTLDDIIGVFRRLGFAVADGPHLELDFYNFAALNFPADHPARDMQDTFFVDAQSLGAGKFLHSLNDRAAALSESQASNEELRRDVLLRTHTSPVQIRALLKTPPPLRIIAPGAVFRNDYDLTHSPMFHQVEGLYVAKEASMAELSWTLDAFAKALFGADRRTRLRPSFFPFVEPGAEVDVSCGVCAGSGTLSSGEPCRTCKSTGWMEILGAGMVHPNVLLACGLDPEGYSGFAFGLGVERVAMLRYGIDDLRLFYENDSRFLAQF